MARAMSKRKMEKEVEEDKKKRGKRISEIE